MEAKVISLSQARDARSIQAETHAGKKRLIQSLIREIADNMGIDLKAPPKYILVKNPAYRG